MPFYNKIPLIGKFLKSEAITKKLTPTEIANYGQAYRDIIGLGDNASFASNVFKKLDAQRIADNGTVPFKSKGPNGVSIQDIIKDDSAPEAQEAAKTVKATIEKLLKIDEAALKQREAAALTAANLIPEEKAKLENKKTESLTDAEKAERKAIKDRATAALTSEEKTALKYIKEMEKFKANMETFPDLIKRIPKDGFGAESTLSTIKYYIDKSRNAIEAQQKLDKDHLEAQFADPGFTDSGFKDNLMKAFSISPADPDATAKIDALKKNMLTDLTNSHKTQISNFDKTTSESINKLLQASAKELKCAGFIEALDKVAENNKMLREIGQTNMNNLGITSPDSTAMHNVDERKRKVKVSHVKISDIPKFKTMTGMEVIQNPPGTFVISLPMISPRYYQSSEQRQVADMLLIAQAIRAQGNDTINWTMDGFKDRDTMIERAKQAYEGSVRAGFALDKITVTDPSGKQLKLEELYQDDPKTLQSLRQRAAQVKQEIANQTLPDIKPNKSKDVKNVMKELRQHYIDHPEAKPAEVVDESIEEDQTATASQKK